MKCKIYEYGTSRRLLKKMLAEGYFPATLKQTWDLREKGKIPKGHYDVFGTIVFKGRIRKPTLKELNDMDPMLEKGMRIFILSDGDDWWSGIGSFRDFGGNDARLVGVKK